MRNGKKFLGVAVFAVLILVLNVSCPQVGAGGYHTVGLRSDGTVVAAGANDYGQCNVGGWADIWWVAAGSYHTVAVKSDYSVVAAGRNDYGQCNVGAWTDIIIVAAGGYHTVGLKEDATAVVAVGRNDYGQCNVGAWTDIRWVAAGYHHTVGLKANGTVVAVGRNDYGQCNVGGWTDIESVAAGAFHTVGRKSDGTVVAVGRNDYGQCDVGGWADIESVAAGGSHTVGLKSDGTVVAVGRNDYGQCDVGAWTDITWLAAGFYHTVGLRSDGTVVAVGDNRDGQCDTDDWVLRIEYDLTITSSERGSVTARYTYGFGFPTPPEYTLEVGAGETGTMSEIPAGTEVTLVAEPQLGYSFINWSGDVDTIADVRSPETTIIVDGNYSIRANFVKYDLTLSSTSGGSVTTPGEGTYTYEGGTVVDLVAVPEDGHLFVNWTGDVATVANVNAPVTTITMNGNYPVKANFRAEPEVQYSLTISSTFGGSVEIPGEGRFTYEAGTVVNLAANPIGDSRFMSWTGDVATIADVNAAVTTITMNDDCSIKAEFSLTGGCGCFIATAAYGTDTAQQIDILREFRDTVLLSSSSGTGFVSFYYRVSPQLAEFISQHDLLRAVVRVGLVDPIAQILSWAMVHGR